MERLEFQRSNLRTMGILLTSIGGLSLLSDIFMMIFWPDWKLLSPGAIVWLLGGLFLLGIGLFMLPRRMLVIDTRARVVSDERSLAGRTFHRLEVPFDQVKCVALYARPTGGRSFWMVDLVLLPYERLLHVDGAPEEAQAERYAAKLSEIIGHPIEKRDRWNKMHWDEGMKA